MVDISDIEEAHNNLRAIKTRTGNNIDGEVLYAALSLITWAGMKKKEIVSAKIQNIDYDGDNIVGINVNSDNSANFIRLFGHPKQVLTEYLQYLNNSEDYDTNPDSPLFPNYIGENGKQNLYRHLNYLGETYERCGHQYKWKLGLLKEVGRTDYYLKKIESEGYEDNEALQETAIQFRISKRQLKDSIDEIKQNSRDESVKLSHHLDQMTVLDFSNERAIEDYKKEGFRLIKKLTRVSEKRSSMIESFESELSKSRAESLRKKSEQRETTPKLHDREEFRKKYDELTPTEENPSLPYFDRIESMWRDDCNDKDDDKDDKDQSDEDDQDISDKN